MSARTRMTWTQAPKRTTQGKQASPPPQTPSIGRTEEPDHPAYYPDPDRDKYEKGNTSTWAEDPKKPMLPESAPPAMPGNLTTEPLEHPATSDFEKGVEKPSKAAAIKEASLTELAERRAAICIRLASALMPGATTAAVEDKALQLMDLDETQLHATIATLKLVSGEMPDFIKEKIEDKEEDEEKDDDDKGADKKASIDVVARLDRLEFRFARLRKVLASFFAMDEKENAADQMMAYLMGADQDGDGIDQSKNDFPQGYDVDKLSGDSDDESMLQAMLDEQDAAMKSANHAEDVVEPLAKGQAIQSGEGGNVNPDAAPKTPQVAGPQKSAGEEEVEEEVEEIDEPSKTAGEEDEEEEEELDVDIMAGSDPMGLMTEASEADTALLSLYADLAKKAGEEEEEIEVTEEKPEETAKEASKRVASAKPGKKTQLRPQSRTAATGAAPAKLGNIERHAAQREVNDLQRLWESAPDVSDVFGIPRS